MKKTQQEFIVLLLLLVLCPAFLLAEVEQTVQIGESQVTFVFEETVAEGVRKMIRQNIALSIDFIQAHADAVVPVLRVAAYADREKFLDAFNATEAERNNPGITGIGNYRRVFFYPGNDKTWESGAPDKRRIVAHEYFHAVQAEFIGQQRFLSLDFGVQWALEGAAEYTATVILDQADVWHLELNRLGRMHPTGAHPSFQLAAPGAPGHLPAQRPASQLPL
jgi:hypothetical protein